MSKRRKTKKIKSINLKKEVLNCFLKNPKKRLNAGTLVKKMKIKGNRDAVANALTSLHAEDILKRVSDHKYVLNRKHKLVSKKKTGSTGKLVYNGTVDMIKSGAAYILVDGLEEDVYVPAPKLRGALNGDEVEVVVTVTTRRRPEGRVKKIVKRNTTQVMGVLRKDKKRYFSLDTMSRHIHKDIKIGIDDLNGAKDGDKVLADIIHWSEDGNQPLWAKVNKTFVGMDDHEWTMESILVENGFHSSHGEAAMKEAAAFPADISEEEIAKRRDFRDILTFTIDPDTAQDFDDAISYHINDKGQREIGVHIADVTHFLRPGTALDKEAFDRSTSVYLVDRCIPMLPERLSNNLCSLMPEVDRLVFSAVFTFDQEDNMVSEWFGKGIIYSDKRFTYEEAQASLEDKKGLYHKELTDVNKVAYKLRKAKFKNGAINFETDEIKFELDENKKPIAVKAKVRKDAHLLIEDFMLLANKRVARFISNKNLEEPIPFVYRVHDHPAMDRVEEFASFVQELGIKLDFSTPEAITVSYNILAKKAQEDELYKLLMDLAIRTMSKAIYSTNNIGHYGLRFDHYAHFTSPIRRYSDVLTHRILEKNLVGNNIREDKNKLEASCIHISKQERKAMEAERDSIKYKQVEFISEHIGETFEGVISGIIERGVFVELSESKAEGFIPFERMRHNFSMGSTRYQAFSRNKKYKLMMGDTIMVRVVDTDLQKRQIEMEVAEE